MTTKQDLQALREWMYNSTHANIYGDKTDCEAMVDGILNILDEAISKMETTTDAEWFFRWIARGKAGYAGMSMEKCADMIWHHPDNPYKENNPWATTEQLTKPEENVSRGVVSNVDETTTEQSSATVAKNATTENGLLPCPFCGCDKIAEQEHLINCPSCLASIPNEVNSVEEMRGCWNTRAADCVGTVDVVEGLEEALECYPSQNEKWLENTLEFARERARKRESSGAIVLQAARAYLTLTKREG